MAMKQHALAALIDDVKAATGWSDEDIAQRARRGGHQLSKQTIALMRTTDPIKTLVPSTLRALADGLGVPLARVVEVALPSAGLPSGHPEDWSIEAAINADPQLPLPAKRMLLSLIRDARETGEGRDRGSTPIAGRRLQAAHEETTRPTPRRRPPKDDKR